MANFTESLTIRILGDSSQLQRELAAVTAGIADLQRQLSALDDVGRRIAQSTSSLGSLMRPLQSVSRLLEGVAGQIRRIIQTPITLNVAPALGALSALSRAAARVAGQLRRLSSLRSLPAVPFTLARPVRRFAQGGLVSGPAGADRVPALLSGGEFVIREPAVRQLGTAFLEALNQNAHSHVPPRQPLPPAQSSGTVNNFGGVSIHVSRPADINAVVRDLRLQGFRLRNRRG